MKLYIKSFKLVTYFILFLSLFFGFMDLVNRHFIGLFLMSVIFIIWYNTYTNLKKATKKSLFISFAVVNIFWLPLLYRTIERVLFIMHNEGMERADGYGSPMAFLLGIFFEQLFFIPLTIVWSIGLFTIFSKRSI